MLFSSTTSTTGSAARHGQDRRDPVATVDENAAVLVNAVYFNAHWRSEFLASATNDEAFHLDRSQTVQTPTMHKTENFALARHPASAPSRCPTTSAASRWSSFCPTR